MSLSRKSLRLWGVALCALGIGTASANIPLAAGEVVRLSAATDTAPVGARTDQSRSTDTPEVAR